MKKVLIGIVVVVVVAVVGFLGVAMMQPSEIHVERSVTIDASPADVFVFVHDLRAFVEWSPWSDLDPDQTSEFSDPSTGVGAWYSWAGNDEVGVGKMTITEVEQDNKVAQELAFFEPFESRGQVSFLLAPAGDGTEVTWTFDAHAGLMMKIMGLFMSMDDMLGGDYEKGLATLKPRVEAAVVERLAAEEAARVAAEAAAEDGAEGDGGPTPVSP